MQHSTSDNINIMGRLPRLALLLGLCAVVYFLSAKFDILEWFVQFSRDHENLELDELIIVLASLAVFFAIYNFILFRKARSQQRALARANQDLHKALADIKQLKGMIPICANCKSIRNDEGYWQQLESYIRDHTDAEFSHGLCPTCIAELYPDLDRSKDTSPKAS